MDYSLNYVILVMYVATYIRNNVCKINNYNIVATLFLLAPDLIKDKADIRC